MRLDMRTSLHDQGPGLPLSGQC